MKTNVLSQLGLGILILAVFLGVFNGLQNQAVYDSTLGQISENYLREGTWGNQYVTRVDSAFSSISNDNLLNWDAAIYRCISEKMYQPGTDCYGSVRGAFFPLFPLIWRLTQLDAQGISILNYLLFVLSISILVQIFLVATPFKKNLVFLALITLPSSIIYFIPYSESLFLATMTLVVYGIMKRKYWLYFIGIALMSMVRPATLFILIAMLVIEVYDFLKHRSPHRLTKELISKLSPFIAGYSLTLIIQYSYSGKWTTYLDAAEFWGGGLKSFISISDWSIEGFGLSIFAICFVILPSLMYMLWMLLRQSDQWTFSFSSSQSINPRNFLCILSSLYLCGIFLFTLLTSGGNLHSFFRFTLCSPLFYVLLLALIDRTSNIKALHLSIALCISTLLFLFLLYTLDYGGNRFNFSFFGPLIYIAYFTLLSIPIRISALRIISLLILVGSSIVWNSYLLNILLSNGYIFT